VENAPRILAKQIDEKTPMALRVMTNAQRTAFETNGFLVIENALSPDELSQVRMQAEQAERLWAQNPSLPGTRRPELSELIAPIEYGPALRDLLWHPRTFPIVREILGDDVSMIDNSYFITPPHAPRTHVDWHHDVALPGVYHPLSVMMVKVFFLLSDVGEKSGGTVLLPGSHRLPMDFDYPRLDDPRDMPDAVQILGPAGTAYLFNGRVYHAATNNESDHPRKALIYNYGHHWMKIWPGYEPSQELLDWARETGDPAKMQVLGLGPAYATSLKD
jgi:phytanoyl-CoA hydroxylase